MPFWFKTGTSEVVVDANGLPISCGTCPCFNCFDCICGFTTLTMTITDISGCSALAGIHTLVRGGGPSCENYNWSKVIGTAFGPCTFSMTCADSGAFSFGMSIVGTGPTIVLASELSCSPLYALFNVTINDLFCCNGSFTIEVTE